MRHRTKFRENWSNRSGDMADFRFFKMAAAAILDFGNFKFLTVGTLKRSNCVCMPNFGEIAQNAAEIWRFFNFSRWRPSAILDFQKLEISTFGPIRMPSMRHRTKFSRRSVEPIRRYGRFFDFSRWLGRSKGLNCVCVPNFVEIAQIRAEIWRFFDFS